MLLSEKGRLPFGGLTDISEHLGRAQAGGMLQGSALLRVADCIRISRIVRRHIHSMHEDLPGLWSLAESLTEQPELQEDIQQKLDDEGFVRPDASPKLIRLHDRVAELEENLRSRMQSIMRTAAGRDLLQDSVIVRREGRFCLPVRSEHRSRFEGIVHDRSASGATIFMEPNAVRDTGNELRETHLEIREEEEAVLRALSARVGEIHADIEYSMETLSILDFILAKGRLSIDMQASAAEITTSGVVSLRSARHPLISDDDVVPISIWIGEEFRTLVITGPNTGGKTVCLKTLGLLVLMAMSGLHIPAEEGSEISLFEHVWADIGDEQSIEQSLSTFSSHMTQIVKIINRIASHRADNQDRGVRALVLLDEIGAGTDPTEGSALARSILTELHTAGCRTAVTTHYNNLKLFAYDQDGMQNAAVQFDEQTLQPTYRLLIGHLGSSNAFEIAQRLGLPARLVERARGNMDEDHMSLERAITDMRDTKHDFERKSAEVQQEAEKLQDLRGEYEEALEDLARERSKATGEAYKKAMEIVEVAEEKVRSIIAQMQAEPGQSKVTQKLRDDIARLREESRRAYEEHERSRVEETETAPETPPPEDLSDGAWVHVESLGRDGTISRQVDDSTYEVAIGNMRVEADLADLTDAKSPPSQEAAGLARRMQAEKRATFDPEIDLRGATVSEAIMELEKYLDDAALANISEVRIIHGKGTGTLRQGVHSFLSENEHVAEFEVAPVEEGGAGATIVHLK